MYTNSKIKERKVISYIIFKAKKVIPFGCQICNTLFTHMDIIGNMNNLNEQVSYMLYDSSVPFRIPYERQRNEFVLC